MGAFYNTYDDAARWRLYHFRTVEISFFFFLLFYVTLVQTPRRAIFYGLFHVVLLSLVWKYFINFRLPCGAGIFLFLFFTKSWLENHIDFFFLLRLCLLLHLNSLELFMPSFKAAGETLHPVMYIKLDTYVFPVQNLICKLNMKKNRHLV